MFVIYFWVLYLVFVSCRVKQGNKLHKTHKISSSIASVLAFFLHSMELSVPHTCFVNRNPSFSSSPLLKSRLLLVPTSNQIKNPLVSFTQRNRFNSMESQRATICSASSLVKDHGSATTTDSPMDTGNPNFWSFMSYWWFNQSHS